MGNHRGRDYQPQVLAQESDPTHRSGRQDQRWLRDIFHETGNPPPRNPTSGFLKTPQVSGITYQVGQDTLLRPLFETTGVLNNTVDNEFRKIGDKWPIFAFAHDLGTIGISGSTPVVYTIGYVRDPLVQLLNLSGVNNMRPPYYLTRYGSVPGMVSQLCTS